MVEEKEELNLVLEELKEELVNEVEEELFNFVKIFVNYINSFMIFFY